jgi:hypothetical protein
LCCALIAAALATPARSADAPLKEDRIKFFVHDDVAGQLTAAQVGGYLDSLNIVLQQSQDPVDVPTCTQFDTLTSGGPPPELFLTAGALSANHAIIDIEQELLDVLAWAATQGDRVVLFVQDITWCGVPLPNAIGCAPTPGNVSVVSLTASATLRPLVIGHERGHNAGLPHRGTDNCALMKASASAGQGCLDQTEAKAFWNQANITTGDTCECIDLVQAGPNQTWSANPPGTVCDDDDVCTTTSSCLDGLCEGGTALNCDDANPCTSEACDAVTGCSNPPVWDGFPCLDGTVCNGFEFCYSGVCTPGTPMVCDDLQFCNGPETCDPSLGCQAGVPPPVDDGIACTLDSCDEVGDTIVHNPNPALCDDLDSCTAESCDEITGCASDPIPGCTPGVPSASPAGRALLAGVLAVAGACVMVVRPRRRSR